MNSERLGRGLADFMRGFLAATPDQHTSAVAPVVETGGTYNKGLGAEAAREASSFRSDEYSNLAAKQAGGGPRDFPADYKLWCDINHAPKLRAGNLIVVHLATSHCYQVDVDTGDITFLFSLRWGPRTFMWRAIADTDGNIYCSVSGTLASTDGRIPPGFAPPAAKFQYWGAVVRVNHRAGTMDVLAETPAPGVGEVLDPHGMQLLADGRLLVCDFQGFGGGGAVYTLQKNAKVINGVTLLSKSRLFNTPVSALLDDDGILWVASADMTDENDGVIIRITPEGNEEIFLPPGGKNSGQVVGVLQAPKRNQLVVFRCEWPNVRGNSAVFLLDKKTRKVRPLFRSTVDDPKFYNTNGDVAGNILWFGESVRKEIVGYDLETEKIVKTIDFLAVGGGFRGMIDSYDGIESVTVIPEQRVGGSDIAQQHRSIQP